jgi:hypothetical protein
MARKVVVFNMGDNSRQEVYSSAGTWAQLLGESDAIRRMVLPDMKIVIKQTKTTIESDSSVLPDGEVTIYLTPGKVKAGARHYNYRSRIKTEAAKKIAPLLGALKTDLVVLRDAVATTITKMA